MKKILFLIFTLCAVTINAQFLDYPQHSLSIGVQPGYGLLQMTGNLNNKGAVTFGYGFSYQYRISTNIGLSVGLLNRKYIGEVDMINYKSSIEMQDQDANNYRFNQDFNSIEKNEVDYAEIFAKLDLIFPIIPDLTDFIGSIGFAYGIPTIQKHSMTGEYSRTLDFYDIHVSIDDLSSMNIGTYKNFIPAKESNIFKSDFSGLLDLGFRIYLSELITANLKFVAAYGFSNIQNSPQQFINFDSYEGIAGSDKTKVNTLFVGAELGLSFYLW